MLENKRIFALGVRFKRVLVSSRGVDLNECFEVLEGYREFDEPRRFVMLDTKLFDR